MWERSTAHALPHRGTLIQTELSKFIPHIKPFITTDPAIMRFQQKECQNEVNGIVIILLDLFPSDFSAYTSKLAAERVWVRWVGVSPAQRTPLPHPLETETRMQVNKTVVGVVCNRSVRVIG